MLFWERITLPGEVFYIVLLEYIKIAILVDLSKSHKMNTL